jgi:hypothetical protein
MSSSISYPVDCTWCRIRLAEGDAAPILYARLPGVPDEQNMQCADEDACARRQDALDAATIVTSSPGSATRMISRITPGIQAAMDDGDRLREAITRLGTGHG